MKIISDKKGNIHITGNLNDGSLELHSYRDIIFHGLSEPMCLIKDSGKGGMFDVVTAYSMDGIGASLGFLGDDNRCNVSLNEFRQWRDNILQGIIDNDFNTECFNILMLNANEEEKIEHTKILSDALFSQINPVELKDRLVGFMKKMIIKYVINI